MKLDRFLRGRPFLILMLLVGTYLRVVGLNNVSPPGLAHDEVANWLINRSILDGNHAIYFTRAYGHEAGFHYIQTLFITILGDNAFALRLPSAFAGVLGIAVCYALVRELFGRETAVYAAALNALLFFPIFYSRLALRAILLPVTAGLSAIFWLQAWRSRAERNEKQSTVNSQQSAVNSQQSAVNSQQSTVNSQQSTSVTLSPPHPLTPSPPRLLALSGLFAGLSLNIYLAARALPIFYALWVVYLMATDWQTFRQKWVGVVWFTAVFAIISAPLLIFLQTNPGAEFRVAEVNEPLIRLLAGDIYPVLDNSWRILAGFGLRGDPLWRQNVAFVPIFEPIVGVLFYVGLAIVILGWKRPSNVFTLLWLGTAVLPSLLTINAPSTIRMILLLPLITVLPARLIHTFPNLSTVIPDLSTDLRKMRGMLLLTILLVYGVRTVWLTFGVWPSGGDIPFVWQAGFTEIAEQIQTTAQAETISVGGWSPDTMDQPTMTLLFDGALTAMSFFNPQDGTVILGVEGETAVYLPSLLELSPELGNVLTINRQQSTVNSQRLTVNHQRDLCDVQPATCIPINTTFGDQLLLEQLIIRDTHLFTVWQTTALPQQPMRLFVQLLDEAGGVLAEDYVWDNEDPQGIWFSHWQEGVRIVQLHRLAVGEDTAVLRIGIFNPYTCTPGPCQNLPTVSGEPFITIPLR